MPLAGLDLAVIFAYLAIVLGIGVWASRGENTAEDYFLAGRALPWWLIGFSLFASNMSGASFVGLVGAAYEEGMVVYNYEWTAALVLIVFALVMLPAFLRARVFTVPEYLETRFDRRARLAYSGFTIATLLFIDMAGALYAGGVVVSTLFPQVTLTQAGAGLALISGAYTLAGGLRAVVLTDALQAIVMYLGAGALFVLGLDAVGGMDALYAALDSSMTRLAAPASDDFMPWPGVGGVLLLGFYYWTLNQYFVQRALAARSLDEGRKGALFGGLLKLPNVALMILPGMMAAVLLPNLDSPDQAFPALAAQLLPDGLRGLVLVALIAAIMSSLDSALNAASSLLTMDFVRPFRPQTTPRTLMWIGRGFTALLIAIAAVYAPIIESFGSLFAYFQSTLAYLVPPIVAVYFAGLFTRRAGPQAGFWGLTLGVGGGLTFYLAQEVTGLWETAGLAPVHFTYVAMLMFGLTLALMLAIALAERAGLAPRETVAERGDLNRDVGTTLLGDHRLHAAALFAVMVGVIWAFW